MFSFVYGSWGPLDSVKRLSRGVGTFCPPGEPIPRTLLFQFVSPLSNMSTFFQHSLPYLTILKPISHMFNDFSVYFNIFQLPCTLKAWGVACHSLAGAFFDTKNTSNLPRQVPEGSCRQRGGGTPPPLRGQVPQGIPSPEGGTPPITDRILKGSCLLWGGTPP